MKKLLTPADVAEILGGKTTAAWVRQQCRAGEIDSIEVGRHYRIDPDDLDAYLNRNKHVSSIKHVEFEPEPVPTIERGSVLHLVRGRAAA